MEDSSSSTNEEDSKGDSAFVVTPPLFPKPTREEAEHLYQDMISAMKNHNQGFLDLIGDSPHALALRYLLVGRSPDLPTSWDELMAARVRFDFPYSSFLLDTVNKTTTMVPYTLEGFEGTADKPKIPNLFLRKALLVILSSYPETDQSRFVVRSDKANLERLPLLLSLLVGCTGPVTIALPNWFS
jgi:hypothetical protein